MGIQAKQTNKDIKKIPFFIFYFFNIR